MTNACNENKLSINVLVADTLFLPQEFVDEKSLISVFPVKKNDGAYRSGLDELLERSKALSRFYDKFLPELQKCWGGWFIGVGGQTSMILRPHLVNITCIFVDRYIRTLYRLEQLRGERVSVMHVKTGSHDSLSFGSWADNQGLIQRLMCGLGFEAVRILDEQEYPEYPSEKSVPKVTFAPHRGVKDIAIRKINGIRRRLDMVIDSLGHTHADYLGAGFCYDDYYMSIGAMYKPFGRIRRVDLNFTLDREGKNQSVRESLRCSLGHIDHEMFYSLLKDVVLFDSSYHSLSLAFSVWADMMTELFPVPYLESFAENMKKAEEILPKESSVLIGSQLTAGPSALLCVLCARKMGMKIVGVTHSAGHYGYIEDFSQVAQSEYSLYDVLFTFGWDRIDAHLPQCKCIPVPSPRLSEKPICYDYIGRWISVPNSVADLLFLSNLFHRFPKDSTCGHSRVDFIDDITDSQEFLMACLSDEGFSVVHKPYNLRYVSLYPSHYSRLQQAGGVGYRLIESTQIGLSVDLIKKAKIVLWDQIGSGTIDCFTSQVPTMVYWQRIYSREAPWAKDLFLELELCGVVHSSPETLVRELKVYLSDPKAWMSDTRRSKAVEDFCFHFGRTDPNWAIIWRENLKSLVQHPPKHLEN